MSFAVRGQWMQHAHRPATTVCVCVFTLLTDKMVDTDTGLCVCVCVSLGEQAAFIP